MQNLIVWMEEALEKLMILRLSNDDRIAIHSHISVQFAEAALPRSISNNDGSRTECS